MFEVSPCMKPARILGVADADDILVSATTRSLAHNSGFSFHDRGAHVLKGLQGEWQLFGAYEQEKSALDCTDKSVTEKSRPSASDVGLRTNRISSRK